VTVPGVGIDIITLRRMRDALERSGKPFIDRAFTPGEQERAASRPDPIAFYAMTFAAKEAIAKAFGIGLDGIELTDIEIRDGPNGEPIPVLRGRLGELMSERAACISVSVTYDGDHAVAVALLSGR
jgi:holo-[acyl-carrier protein] synthase